MEAKLKEYRALRRRREIIENCKDTLEKTKEKVVKFITPKFIAEMGKQNNEDEVLLMENEVEAAQELPPLEDLSNDIAPEASELETLEEENEESWRYCITKWFIYLIIWSTLFGIFLKLQFGAVFFAVSALLGIYFNTRTRPRKRGEASAYSVFNKNCESLDGTLTAEKLQQQMMFGGIIR